MTPDYKITANDDDITKLIEDRFMELRLVDENGIKSDSFELRLDDNENVIEMMSNDVELTIELGFDGKLEQMGKFAGLELEFSGPPSVVTVRATSVNLRKSMKAKKTRSFDLVSFGDLVSTVASEYGYDALVDDLVASIEFAHIAQTTESDWSLLNRLARDYDAFVKVGGGKLIVAVRSSIGVKKSLVTGDLLPSVVLQPGDVETWSVKHNDKTKYKAVIAKWYDKDAAILNEVMSGDGVPSMELAKHYDNEEDAQRAADARLKKLQRVTKMVTIKTKGRTDATAMGDLTLKNFRNGVDGSYTFTRVEHVVKKETGYRCSFEAEL